MIHKFAILFAISFSALAGSQYDPMLAHDQMCQGKTDCRVNVIETKVDELSGSCQAILQQQYNCELSYSRKGEVSAMKLFCKDLEHNTVVDQVLEATSLSYQVAAITKLFEHETFEIDDKNYVYFDHPAIKLSLAQTQETIDATMIIMMNQEPVAFTDVVCK